MSDDRCNSCRHFERSDLFGFGRCKELFEVVELEVKCMAYCYGGSVDEILIPDNFGCILHENKFTKDARE
jgi:hypothetical protein